MLVSILLALAGIVSLSTAGYVLEDDYSVDKFFSMFDFFTAADPTNGYVKYVDQNTAQNGGLISTNNGAVYMGVDHTNIATGSGRQSVRLTSKKSYTHGLIILDLSHMPGGICGTWPAFWTVGPNWPNSGEIDIIEGVNSQVSNSMALHTSAGCSIANNGLFSGSITTPNCFVNAPDQSTNAGCQIVTPNEASYGTGFNQGQGGAYATEWTSEAISIWFFPRSAIPSDISSGNPDPSNWGSPTASFSGGCEIDQYFNNHQIVFDTTFCGDWAGNVWNTDSTCSSKAATCQSFVQNNPSAFADAYWTVNFLKVYQSTDSGSGTYSVASQGPTSSVSQGIPPPSTPAASHIRTTGFSREGNGRQTKSWGAAANFVALPSDSSVAASATDSPAAAMAVESDGSVTEAVPSIPSASASPPDITPAAAADEPVESTNADPNFKYVTVSALSFDDFPKKKRELALDEAIHLPTHRHAHVHRHLFKHGVGMKKE
ncbi:uncharacterized protein Z518_09125 [Rhinocladiella mackenziei CBS 650.93]|uniref:endo-1,3(4)-beta-glucanase n=1 Tax=Rhinocladiella mackenziei CBS 650.93 TaxID=1442369 RepID=A0A0D2I6G8_9EURO|nr:uncharacterized protein Z518_09125 [Rhinocladiella mackenziei CBS 650.93]KIX01399.1 hypothetical protein Z518_09125 [Rhinocladiella mackenziei CBS 650.93]